MITLCKRCFDVVREYIADSPECQIFSNSSCDVCERKEFTMSFEPEQFVMADAFFDLAQILLKESK